jgi:hypothetical protein
MIIWFPFGPGLGVSSQNHANPGFQNRLNRVFKHNSIPIETVGRHGQKAEQLEVVICGWSIYDSKF